MSDADLPTEPRTMQPPPAEGAPPGYAQTGWGRVRGWRPSARGLALTVLLLIALLMLMLTATPRTGYLDPAAVDPAGSRAVANVLADQGVEVLDVRTSMAAVANARDATVLVTDTTLLSPSMVDGLVAARPARVVLVEPIVGTPAVDRLAADIGDGGSAGEDPVAPQCRLPLAQRAGAASLPGARYDTSDAGPSATACYDRADSAALVALPGRSGTPETILLGSGHPLTNAGLAEQGNAALAFALLGARADLVWWRPSLTDPALVGQAGAPIGDLLPDWVIPAIVQILVACLLLVWWRTRRLGALVVEPLPVVVRAGETTAGHARLLHANHARAEAATHLRARARELIRVRLALPVGVAPQNLSDTAARHTSRPAAQVAGLLYGPEPTTDAQLVSLGHELGALLVEVGGT